MVVQLSQAALPKQRLPDPPAQYDPVYFQRLIKTLENNQDVVDPPWPYMLDENKIGYNIQLAYPGVPYGLNTQSGVGVPKQFNVTQQAGTAYTLALTDAGTYLQLTNGSPVTVTIPTFTTVAFPVGSTISFEQNGGGQVTFSPAGGVVVNSISPSLKSLKRFAVVQIVNVAQDTWTLFGALQ